MPLSCHALSYFRDLPRSRLHAAMYCQGFLKSAVLVAPLLIRSSFPHPFQFLCRKKRSPCSEVGTLRPQCLYEHLPLLRLAFLALMLIFSCVVLAIPLIVAASDGVVPPPVGIFEGLLSRFGPQVSRLHSRQTFLVPPECLPVCDTFQTTVGVG